MYHLLYHLATLCTIKIKKLPVYEQCDIEKLLDKFREVYKEYNDVPNEYLDDIFI